MGVVVPGADQRSSAMTRAPVPIRKRGARGSRKTVSDEEARFGDAIAFVKSHENKEGSRNKDRSTHDLLSSTLLSLISSSLTHPSMPTRSVP